MSDSLYRPRTGPLDGRLFADNGISLTPAPAEPVSCCEYARKARPTAKRTWVCSAGTNRDHRLQRAMRIAYGSVPTSGW